MNATGQASPHQQMTALQLGDVVLTADGRSHTVRAVERRLAQTVGDMAGFVLAGEVGPQSVLLSISRHAGAPVDAYTPIDHIPAHARDARSICEGVVSYWAPHLPNLSGALGELAYKVCSVRGSIEPMVILWRNAERVVFIKTGSFVPGSIGFMSLPRDADSTEEDVARYAATVGTEHAAQPQHERSRTKQGTFERLRRRVPVGR